MAAPPASSSTSRSPKRSAGLDWEKTDLTELHGARHAARAESDLGGLIAMFARILDADPAGVSARIEKNTCSLTLITPPRKHQHMIPNSRMTVAAMFGAATIAGVVACSHAGTPASSGTTTTTQAVSSALPQAPASQTEASAGGINASITPEGDTTVRPGGPPMRFSVTLQNAGDDVAAVGMVVSLGHCSCGPPGASPMESGSMRMRDTQTNAWVTAPYVREGTGMDYILGNLVKPFPLSHGQTVTYQLEMQLDADQPFTVTKGESSINVTLTDPDNPMEGHRPGKGATLHIDVDLA
jgi:hypothetical protein